MGWFRLHPLLHLPIEAFAFPLAIAGLRGALAPWPPAFLSGFPAGQRLHRCGHGPHRVMAVLAPVVLNASLADAPLLLAESRPTGACIPSPCSWWRASPSTGVMALGRRLAAEDCARPGRRPQALVMTLAVDACSLMAGLGSPPSSVADLKPGLKTAKLERAEREQAAAWL